MRSDDNINGSMSNAILCAGMINSTCNNYKITFSSLHSDTNYLSPRGRIRDSAIKRNSVVSSQETNQSRSSHNETISNEKTSNPNSARSGSNNDTSDGRSRGDSFDDDAMPTRKSSLSIDVNLNSVPFLNIKDSNVITDDLTTAKGSRRNSVITESIDEDLPVRRNSLIFTPNIRRNSILADNLSFNQYKHNSKDKLSDLDLPSLDMSKESKEETVYLYVHSGISSGLLAGVDVCFNGRSEFFMIGQPMYDVAIAEKLAVRGELVVSLNKFDEFNDYLEKNKKSQKLKFEYLSNNCYKVNFIDEIPKFFGENKMLIQNSFIMSLLTGYRLILMYFSNFFILVLDNLNYRY